ncbi:MAG: hypothetical protein WCR06_05040 [bacterium]
MKRIHFDFTLAIIAVTVLLTAGALATPATINTNFLLLGRGDKVERWGVSGTGASAIWAKSNDVLQIVSGDLGGNAAWIVDLAFSPDGTKLAVLNYQSATHSLILLYNYNSVTHTATGAGTNSGALLAADVGEARGIAWNPTDTNIYVSTGLAAPLKVLKVNTVTGAKSDFTAAMGRPSGVCFGPDISGDGLPDMFVVDLSNARVSAFNGTNGATINQSYFTHTTPNTIKWLPHAGSNYFYVTSYNGGGGRMRRYASDGVRDTTTSDDVNAPNWGPAGDGPTVGSNAGPIPALYGIRDIAVAGDVLTYGSANFVSAFWTGRAGGYFGFAGSTCAGGITFESIQVIAGGTPVIQNLPAANITQSSATLQGNVVTNGGVDTYVSVFWGTADGGQALGGWAHTNSFTAPLVSGNVSTNVTLDTADVTYYYRFYASNSVAVSWGDKGFFISGSVGMSGTFTNASRQPPVTSGTVTVYRASTATNEATIVTYTLNGSATNVTDYTVTPTAGSVTILKGATNATITITPIFSLTATQTVQAVVTLASGQYVVGTPSNATVNIAPVPIVPLHVPANQATVNSNFLLIGRSGVVERWAVSGSGASATWTFTNTVLTIAASDLGGLGSNAYALAFSPDGKKLAVMNLGTNSTTARVLIYRYDVLTHTATPAGTNSGGALLAANCGEGGGLTFSPNDNYLYVGAGEPGAPGYGKVVLRIDPVTGAKSAFTPALGRPAGVCFGPDITGDGYQDLYAVDINNNRVSAFDGVSGASILASYFATVLTVPVTVNYCAYAGANYFFVTHSAGQMEKYTATGVYLAQTGANGAQAQIAGIGPSVGNDAGPIPGLYAWQSAGNGIMVYRSSDMVWNGWSGRGSGYYTFGAPGDGGLTFEFIQILPPRGTTILFR